MWYTVEDLWTLEYYTQIIFRKLYEEYVWRIGQITLNVIIQSILHRRTVSYKSTFVNQDKKEWLLSSLWRKRIEKNYWGRIRPAKTLEFLSHVFCSPILYNLYIYFSFNSIRKNSILTNINSKQMLYHLQQCVVKL